jgi:hypothetical protein
MFGTTACILNSKSRFFAIVMGLAPGALPEGLGGQNSVFLDFLDRCEWKNEEDAAINLSG